MDIFLNQLIQFHSNNTTNLHHLTSHSIRRVAPQNRHRIVTTDYRNVTWPNVYTISSHIHCQDKRRHYIIIASNFAKCWPIFKILLTTDLTINF